MKKIICALVILVMVLFLVSFYPKDNTALDNMIAASPDVVYNVDG